MKAASFTVGGSTSIGSIWGGAFLRSVSTVGRWTVFGVRRDVLLLLDIELIRCFGLFNLLTLLISLFLAVFSIPGVLLFNRPVEKGFLPFNGEGVYSG